mgnify:CR=1 FL=1
MSEIDIETDLSMVNDQISKLVEELNKVNAARENLIQQVQNLNGVAMYLRGKLPTSETAEPVPDIESDETFQRTTQYPETEKAD